MARKKKITRRTTRNASPKAGPAVRVRMYRQGLGDCFLLTFDLGGREKHMLIDCGTLGNRTTKAKLPDVVDNIAATTGKSLEVVVATHAHKDHVIGFSSQLERFRKMKINQVWMGWTEDPADALAEKLSTDLQAMRLAAVEAATLAGVDDAMREEIAQVLAFELEDHEIGDALAMGRTISESLQHLRDMSKSPPVYHSPGGAPIELDGIPGFRFYVLGPPRDQQKLGNMGRHGSDQLYGLAGAARAHHDPTGQFIDEDTPFDARFRQPLEKTATYYPHYGAKANEHRKIDAAWLAAVADLAAKLDDVRNNTSLALAIERIADGRVLLFPADAQEGNWVSWHDKAMTWKVQDRRGRMKTVTAADLLERTVFYKVGHHASHNATVKEKGLEIMRKNAELVAFIPVDRQLALRQSKKGWRMPAVELYRELLEACQGRVVRSDIGWADDPRRAQSPDVERELTTAADASQWEHWRRSQAQESRVDKPEDLFIDFTLPAPNKL